MENHEPNLLNHYRKALGLPIPGEENTDIDTDRNKAGIITDNEEKKNEAGPQPEPAPVAKPKAKRQKQTEKKPDPEKSRRTAVSLSKPFVSTLWSYHFYLVHRRGIPIRSMESVLRRLLDMELARDPDAKKFIEQDRYPF